MRWFRNWVPRLKLGVSRGKHDRALILATVVALTAVTFVVVDWAADSGLLTRLLFPSLKTTPDVQAWNALVYTSIFVLGLPPAFLLWHWRDRNVRDQIDAQRKDVNLKEFQEVQLRAVGAVGDETSNDAKYILQVAALHQLRGFLKGDFGPAFRRPAFETYCALLSRSDASEWEEGDEQENLIPHEIFEALRSIVFEDWQWVFWENFEKRTGWPLAGRSFHRIKLPPGADLGGLDLSRVNFFRSELDMVSFRESQCSEANFSRCGLRCTRFDSCSCEDARFNDSDLAGASAVSADFSGASFNRTKFHAADFTRASFFRSKGGECEFVNTTLLDSNFNDCRFVKANFQNSRLQGAKFVSASITNGSIAGADVRDCDFSYAMLDGFYPFHAQNCAGVIINEKTWLPHPDASPTEELLSAERKEILSLWSRHGATLVDIDLEADDQALINKDSAIEERRRQFESIRTSAFEGILNKKS